MYAMKTIQTDIAKFKKQIEIGSMQRAYRALHQFMMDLRVIFSKEHPEYDVSGSYYHGYMDMTYFPVFTKVLKRHHLKIAIVLNYEPFRIEAWLSGSNKRIQKEYWTLLKEFNWKKYKVVDDLKGSDSIMEYILVEKIDLDNEKTITKQIIKRTTDFINDIENYLAK
jgi:hypothetical protein